MNLERKKTLDLWLGGLALFLLKPIVAGLGVALRREHQLEVRGGIFVMKLQGGGSLLLALPALLGLKRRYPERRLVLICTPGVQAFARLLGVFDDYRVIDDRDAPRMLLSSVRCLASSFRSDTFIDFEVYSRLSSVFSVLTAARNRIGFYLESTFWRERLHTHLIYFGRHAAVQHFYARVAELLGAEVASAEECAAQLRGRLAQLRSEAGSKLQYAADERYLCIGSTCSELGRERMLTPSMWRQVFEQRFGALELERVVFLGVAADREFVASVVDELQRALPDVRFDVLCGELSLAESVHVLSGAQHFWGVDSGLLHFARLLCVRSLSYWGPTSPATRLVPIPGLEEEVVYRPIACSPCVHSAEIPPCRGDNQCVKRLFAEPEQENFVPVLGPEAFESPGAPSA